jgi:hypothetical protein
MQDKLILPKFVVVSDSQNENLREQLKAIGV